MSNNFSYRAIKTRHTGNGRSSHVVVSGCRKNSMIAASASSSKASWYGSARTCSQRAMKTALKNHKSEITRAGAMPFLADSPMRGLPCWMD